jgi:tetratricopeptide (TPR) repeat protein
MKSMLSLLLCLAVFGAPSSRALGDKLEDYRDPLDPFERRSAPSQNPDGSDPDVDKTPLELIREGANALADERLLDARTKLLKALQKDPNEYKAHYMLAGYYMVHVGHYRLALKYIKRAQQLFEERNGPPPYQDAGLQLEHSTILYYLSQVRLNLDNYQGALDTLDEYAKLNYYDTWYPGSRAWILMKLDRTQEAIKIARLGILSGAEPGRTMNMLGILLSIVDERAEAIEIFKKAIAYEMSLGTEGQPSTPINNVGEVYKEMFQDEKAEQHWLRIQQFPDGCEHVLPSLNLSLIMIDQARLRDSQSAISFFENCIAQYPLRNSEEHRALVLLARGRILLHSGDVEGAIKNFEACTDGIQWFGKIGTNENDLRVAATISLAQALIRRSNQIRLRRPESWTEWLEMRRQISVNDLRAWWLMRRNRQTLVEELKDLEDLSIRNTDSLIEYPTFGEVLKGLPQKLLLARLDRMKQKDNRGPSHVFYDSYRAEALVDSWWTRNAGLDALGRAIRGTRQDFDKLLFVHLTAVRLQYLPAESDEYRRLAQQIFDILPPALRNYGFRLPVQLAPDLPSEVAFELQAGPFVNDASARCRIEPISSEKRHGARFSCGSAAGQYSSHGDTPAALTNNLSDLVFTLQLK